MRKYLSLILLLLPLIALGGMANGGDDVPRTVRCKGYVRDNDGEPLRWVNVGVYTEGKTVYDSVYFADTLGYFDIEVPVHSIVDFYSYGYQYANFRATTDVEVTAILQHTWTGFPSCVVFPTQELAPNSVPMNEALLYLWGIGRKQNDQKALNYLRLAAIHNDSFAKFMLGSMYLDGIGTKENEEEAFKWFNESAAQGDVYGQVSLAECYLQGKGCRQDVEKAQEWLRKAAKKNFSHAQLSLGILFYQGEYVEQDLDKAFHWFRRAADANHPIAQSIIGFAYLNGEYLPRDASLGFTWVNKAMMQGYPNAYFDYAQYCENHYNNKSQTLVLYREAQERGIEEAKDKVKELEAWFEEHPEEKAPDLTHRYESWNEPETIIPRKTIALLVGNSDYETGRLKNPVRDVTALKAELESLGIETTVSLNGTQQEMEQAIAEFAEAASNYDAALFYFAGHAQQLNGENYLLPIGTLVNRAAVKTKCVSLSWVMQSLMDAGVKSNIIILDACRDNPYAKKWDMASRSVTPKGLADISNLPVGFFLAFATQAGQTAEDGSAQGKKNSPYAAALLEALERPQSIDALFKQVKNAVTRQTDGKQVPVHFNNLDETEGDFYLNQRAAKN